MNIGKKALEQHKNGYNCAQAVFSACTDLVDLDEKTALAISAGFGGGLRSGEVCGAVSGALMAVGMAYPFTDGSDTAAKDKIAALAKQCVAAAKDKYGCVRCAELKGNIDCSEIIAYMAQVAEDIIKNK